MEYVEDSEGAKRGRCEEICVCSRQDGKFFGLKGCTEIIYIYALMKDGFVFNELSV